MKKFLSFVGTCIFLSSATAFPVVDEVDDPHDCIVKMDDLAKQMHVKVGEAIELAEQFFHQFTWANDENNLAVFNGQIKRYVDECTALGWAVAQSYARVQSLAMDDSCDNSSNAVVPGTNTYPLPNSQNGIAITALMKFQKAISALNRLKSINGLVNFPEITEAIINSKQALQLEAGVIDQ